MDNVFKITDKFKSDGFDNAKIINFKSTILVSSIDTKTNERLPEIILMFNDSNNIEYKCSLKLHLLPYLADIYQKALYQAMVQGIIK